MLPNLQPSKVQNTIEIWFIEKIQVFAKQPYSKSVSKSSMSLFMSITVFQALHRDITFKSMLFSRQQIR